MARIQVIEHNEADGRLLEIYNELIDKRQKALCRFAQMLTDKPGDFKEAHETNRLKNIGLSDKAILDATLVVAYFNFVNRMVLALDVQADEEEVSGYKY